MPLKHARGAVTRLGIAGVLAGTFFGCNKPAEREDPNEAIFAEFTRRVDTYVALRNQLADSVGPLNPESSQNDIAARSAKLANAIIAARQGANPGDIFTAEAGAIISTLIKQEYDRRPERVLETRGDAQDEVPDFTPEINQLYPTGYPLATFPASLLPVLPRLPKELEYRIVSRYLILRDIEGNVTIDLMPHAVPQEKLQ